MSSYLRATLSDALVEGRIGTAQAHELARVRANPRCGERLVEVEAVLLEQAEALEFDDFRTVVRRWEMLAILYAFTQGEFDKDQAARLAEFGNDAAGRPLARTGAQRRFDALTEIFRRAANVPDESGRRANVTVNLVVDEYTHTESMVAHGLAPASALDDVADPGLEHRPPAPVHRCCP